MIDTNVFKKKIKQIINNVIITLFYKKCWDCGGGGFVMCNMGHNDVQDVECYNCKGKGMILYFKKY